MMSEVYWAVQVRPRFGTNLLDLFAATTAIMDRPLEELDDGSTVIRARDGKLIIEYFSPGSFWALSFSAQLVMCLNQANLFAEVEAVRLKVV